MRRQATPNSFLYLCISHLPPLPLGHDQVLCILQHPVTPVPIELESRLDLRLRQILFPVQLHNLEERKRLEVYNITRDIYIYMCDSPAILLKLSVLVLDSGLLLLLGPCLVAGLVELFATKNHETRQLG